LARRWFEIDSREVEAITLRGAPARALPLLDSVIAYWDETHIPIRLLRPLLARSEALLATGRVAAAELDLDRAIELLDQQRAEVANATWRAALLESARDVFDRLVMLRVAEHQPADALRYVEKGRISFARQATAPRLHERQLRAPAGEVIVEYALIGDTLLAWTLSDTAVHLTRTTLDRGALVAAVERTRASLELRAGERAVRADLVALYDWLVRPLEARLGPAGTPLVLIGDGEIAGVPFAALLDARRGRFLIESHSIRFVPSLTDAARTWAGPVDERRPTVIIYTGTGPGDPPLPGAAAEVADLRADIPDARVLSASRVGRDSVTRALRSAAVVHFAGHAVFDDDRPERSRLVLGPDPQVADSASLTAEQILNLQLGHLRLVVLAGCETLRARVGRGGGFAGLSAAFLAAGAGGVVGTLWQVDDIATRSLMVEFHRAYRSSGNAASALRAAQVRMLRSSDLALRSPAAWAGFRYAGS
jgi:CHAT domain-containing protein